MAQGFVGSKTRIKSASSRTNNANGSVIFDESVDQLYVAEFRAARMWHALLGAEAELPTTDPEEIAGGSCAKAGCAC